MKVIIPRSSAVFFGQAAVDEKVEMPQPLNQAVVAESDLKSVVGRVVSARMFAEAAQRGRLIVSERATKGAVDRVFTVEMLFEKAAESDQVVAAKKGKEVAFYVTVGTAILFVLGLLIWFEEKNRIL